MNQWIIRCASLPAVGMMVRVACVALMVAACGTNVVLEPGTQEDISDEDTGIKHDAEKKWSARLLSDVPVQNSSWPQSGQNMAHVMTPFSVPHSLTLVKKIKVSAPYVHTIQPVTNTNYIFVVTKSGTVAAMTFQGEKKWETALPSKPHHDNAGQLLGGIACNEHYVYVTTPKRQVVCLNSDTGKVVWTFNTRTPARGGPCLHNDTVVITTVDSCVHCINASTGKRVWEYIHPYPENTSLLHFHPPALWNNRVVSGTTSGELVCLDENDGSMVWSSNVCALPKLRTIVHVGASPVIRNNRVYSLSYNGQITCSDMETGESIWDSLVKSAYAPVMNASVLFVVAENKELHAIDAHSGQTYWHTALPKNLKDSSPPLYAGRYIYVVGSGGVMMALDPCKKGEVAHTWTLGESCTCAPIVANNTMIVLSDQGTLFLFSASKDTP